jgi:4-amino-4-deoxy-L-arabinose transferase-like glycosyltransferase
MVAPSYAWIWLDRAVWPYDQAWYGQVSVDLFVIGTASPDAWPAAMLQSFVIKAPGIAWLGQAFVPLGMALGSIEKGLGLSVVLTQIATLLILLVSVRALAHRWSVALVSCMLLASAPLFIAMSNQYFVEPLQTLAVAWFIALAVFASRWRWQVTAVHLVAATAVAMLAKTSSPLYCFAPGLFSLVSMIRRAGQTRQCLGHQRLDIRLIAGAALSLAMLAATMSWYTVNFDALVQFTVSTSSGPVALNYGSVGSLPNKLQFWFAAARQNYFLPQVVVFLAMLTAFALAIRIRTRNARLDRLDVFAALAIVELTTVLIIFSFQVNEEVRYLLPLAPYLALLLTWVLTRINRLLVTQAVALLLIVQTLVVYQRAFGLAPQSDVMSYWVIPVHQDGQDIQDVQAAVTNTCTPADVGRYNVVGVELPWFNSNSLSFFAAKELLRRPGRCYYTTLGYAESNPDEAWERVMELRTRHFLTINPQLEPLPQDAFNRVAQPTLERVEHSDAFAPELVPDHPRLLLFKTTRDP